LTEDISVARVRAAPTTLATGTVAAFVVVSGAPAAVPAATRSWQDVRS
jgi:hypothetical protein